jgi:hypothetical protein
MMAASGVGHGVPEDGWLDAKGNFSVRAVDNRAFTADSLALARKPMTQTTAHPRTDG